MITFIQEYFAEVERLSYIFHIPELFQNCLNTWFIYGAVILSVPYGLETIYFYSDTLDALSKAWMHKLINEVRS